MSKLKTIALTASGLSVCPGFLYAQNTSSHQVGLAIMRLNSSILDLPPTKQYFQSGSLWDELRQGFRMGEVNPELVRRHESKFIASRSYFDRVVNRSRPYMYHIANEVKKRNMPAEAALLPFIESAFVTKAKSHVGASGLWQFMPATGRHYGLEKTPVYDGRHDVYAATDAALNYLQYLYGLFGDWPLAFAAYNWGEGNVGRAVNRARDQGLEPTYENLRMPNETRNYVPKLLAVRNIIATPQSFGMNISDIDNKPYFQAVEPGRPLDNEAIARLAGITQSELLALNPAFNVPAFIPKNKRKLLLPVASVQTFQSNYLNAAPDSLFSWEVYTPAAKTSLSDILDGNRHEHCRHQTPQQPERQPCQRRTQHPCRQERQDPSYGIGIRRFHRHRQYARHLPFQYAGRHGERQHCPNPTRRRTDSGHYRRTFAARNRPYGTRSPCPHCRTRPCDSRSATSNRKTDCHAV